MGRASYRTPERIEQAHNAGIRGTVSKGAMRRAAPVGRLCSAVKHSAVAQLDSAFTTTLRSVGQITSWRQTFCVHFDRSSAPT
jgi:hypothetical protein